MKSHPIYLKQLYSDLEGEKRMHYNIYNDDQENDEEKIYYNKELIKMDEYRYNPLSLTPI